MELHGWKKIVWQANMSTAKNIWLSQDGILMLSRVYCSKHGKNGFVTATKLGTTDKIFVAATKNFAAASKRFVDRTKHFAVVTKCFCYRYFNK